MAPVEISPQSLAQLTLEDSEIAGKLGRQIEVPMVHGPDLDPKPPSGHRPFCGTEPRHAVRQADLREPGIAKQFSPEKVGKVVASLFKTVRVAPGPLPWPIWHSICLPGEVPTPIRPTSGRDPCASPPLVRSPDCRWGYGWYSPSQRVVVRPSPRQCRPPPPPLGSQLRTLA